MESFGSRDTIHGQLDLHRVVDIVDDELEDTAKIFRRIG